MSLVIVWAFSVSFLIHLFQSHLICASEKQFLQWVWKGWIILWKLSQIKISQIKPTSGPRPPQIETHLNGYELAGHREALLSFSFLPHMFNLALTRNGMNENFIRLGIQRGSYCLTNLFHHASNTRACKFHIFHPHSLIYVTIDTKTLYEMFGVVSAASDKVFSCERQGRILSVDPNS